MILITATYTDNNDPLYFWGYDDLSTGCADSTITNIFELSFIAGVVPWSKFFADNCSILVTYPNINSLADAQRLLPELLL